MEPLLPGPGGVRAEAHPGAAQHGRRPGAAGGSPLEAGRAAERRSERLQATVWGLFRMRFAWFREVQLGLAQEALGGAAARAEEPRVSVPCEHAGQPADEDADGGGHREDAAGGEVPRHVAGLLAQEGEGTGEHPGAVTSGLRLVGQRIRHSVGL